MYTEPPQVLILAGPNGAGKTTAAGELLSRTAKQYAFVNADIIAQGLGGPASSSVELEAGRIMLARLRGLAEERQNFAFETTLASRSFAPWISTLRQDGYQARLIYFWLRSPETAVKRVSDRVRLGGHNVPEETIRRRYNRGIRNFFDLYQNVVDWWEFYDSSWRVPALIAKKGIHSPVEIQDERLWEKVLRIYRR